MKTAIEYILEASNDFKTTIKNLEYETQEPSNKEDYVKILTQGKTWKDEGPSLWVKTSSLKYDTETQVLSVAYNLMKDVYPAGVMAEIMTYNPEDKEYQTFAVAHLQKKNRMWHPEWIVSDKYSFK